MVAAKAPAGQSIQRGLCIVRSKGSFRNRPARHLEMEPVIGHNIALALPRCRPGDQIGTTGGEQYLKVHFACRARVLDDLTFVRVGKNPSREEP